TVGKDDEDALLLLDAQPLERRGHLAHALPELGVADVDALPVRTKAQRDASIVAAAQDLRSDVEVSGFVARGHRESGELLLVVAHVLEVDRLVIDAARGRGDPAREVARLEHRVSHEAPDVGAVRLRGKPLVAVALERLARDLATRGVEEVAGERPPMAVEAARREDEPHAGSLEPPVPAVERLLAVLH